MRRAMARPRPAPLVELCPLRARAAVEPNEALEDPLARLGRNPEPGVDDGDLVRRAPVRHDHFDRAPVGCVLDRVVEQIQQQAAEEIRVALEWRFDHVL
jgi:hypothetical protein